MLGDRLYWSFFLGNKIESSVAEEGSTIRIEYEGMVALSHLAVPTRNPSRPNPCEGRPCNGSGICVITPTAFRCPQPWTTFTLPQLGVHFSSLVRLDGENRR